MKVAHVRERGGTWCPRHSVPYQVRCGGNGGRGRRRTMSSDDVVTTDPMQTPNTFWDSLGRPKFILGPMVDQSELAFRLLCRRYGTDIAYTLMLHSRLYVEDEHYRSRNFETCSADGPLIAQFCGNDPAMLGDAAIHIAPHVNAVDINLGCPQGIARRGHYGSFLLDDPDFVERIVAGTVAKSPVPVTCKMRKIDAGDQQSTLNLARRLEAVGCAALCLHGRTREQKGQKCTPADWDIIARAKQILHIPVIANGGVSTREDAVRCLEATGADAVMSAEAILEYPALFSTHQPDIDSLMLEYLELAEMHNTRPPIVKAHLFHSLYAGLQVHTDLRTQLATAKTLDEFKVVATELRTRRIDQPNAEKLGWYYRYRHTKRTEVVPPPSTDNQENVLSCSANVPPRAGGEAAADDVTTQDVKRRKTDDVRPPSGITCENY